MTSNMFHLALPVAEKVLRPVIVYIVLILLLRLFGKRELAQLNPFDLVVLLSLSNTVQNAIIGDDNSVTGGIIGAFSLLGINWLLMRLLYHAPRLNRALEGEKAVLIRDGVVDEAAMTRETLTREELIGVLNKNGYSDPSEIAQCVLEPNGTFFVEARKPSTETAHNREVVQALQTLRSEVQMLRAQLDARG